MSDVRVDVPVLEADEEREDVQACQYVVTFTSKVLAVIQSITEVMGACGQLFQRTGDTCIYAAHGLYGAQMLLEEYRNPGAITKYFGDAILRRIGAGSLVFTFDKPLNKCVFQRKVVELFRSFDAEFKREGYVFVLGPELAVDVDDFSKDLAIITQEATDYQTTDHFDFFDETGAPASAEKIVETQLKWFKMAVRQSAVKKARKPTTNPQELGFIPRTIRHGCVTMTLEPVQIGFNIPTVFIAIVNSSGYGEKHWQDNVKRLAKSFKMADGSYREIKVPPTDGGSSINSEQLTTQMTEAIDLVNRDNYRSVRIVQMGEGSSIALKSAVESLIDGWLLPASEKIVYFVALGESPDNSYLEFAHWLCFSGKCAKLQYYQTLYYNEFGLPDVRTHYVKETEEVKKRHMEMIAADISKSRGRSKNDDRDDD